MFCFGTAENRRIREEERRRRIQEEEEERRQIARDKRAYRAVRRLLVLGI